MVGSEWLWDLNGSDLNGSDLAELTYSRHVVLPTAALPNVNHRVGGNLRPVIKYFLPYDIRRACNR